MEKVWINASSIFDTLIVIGDDAIVTAKLKEEQLEDAKQRIENGEGVLNVLGKDAVHIPYFKIKKIKIEESDTDFEVTYEGEKGSDDKTLDAVDVETRNLMVDMVQLHLGADFTRLTETLSKPRAIFASVMTFTILLFLTGILHSAAASIASGAEVDIHGRSKGVKYVFYWILDLLGPTGVLIVGCLLLMLPMITFYKRLKVPMVVTTIKQGDQKPASMAGTVIRYAMLLAVWYLFGPGMVAAFAS